ncbi:MAG: 4Fe-4S dicluster domain-containing protein [Aquificaceae bacterium]
MLIDIDRCIGCLSCEVACLQEKELKEPEIRPMKVSRVGGFGDGPDLFFVPMNCFHCEPAPCVMACPTGAMVKNSKGVVHLLSTRCIGCKACIIACPFGAISFNPQTMKVEKCDYCIHRLEKGLLPSCVMKCTTNCLYFVYLETAPQARHISQRLDSSLLQELFLKPDMIDKSQTLPHQELQERSQNP